MRWSCGQPPITGELIRTLRGNYAKIEVVDYQPTWRKHGRPFRRRDRKERRAGLELFQIRLHETATSFAEWFRSDNR